MSDFAAMVNAHLGVSQRKQDYLDERSKRKQEYLDPTFEFGVDEVEILDQDTVRLPSGESVRLTAGEGRTLDAYETEASRYQDRPETFERHKQNYARAYGLDPDDVTVEDLVIAGQSQKAKAGERLRSMADENGRIRFKQRGTDDYGRILGEVDPSQVNLSGRQDNADYYSKFNYEQGLADAISGVTGDQEFGQGDRSLKTGAKDQVVNFIGGAGRMANDLVQGAGALVGVNNIPGVDEAHRGVREALDKFKEWGNSPQQQRRERLEQERNELQSEYYNVQKEKYLKDGNSELNASIRAGIDEFTNSVGNIIDNPGAILDKTVESLPYMLGVASAGKAATTAAIKSVHRNVLKNAGVQKNITRGLEKTKGIKGTKGKFQSKDALEKSAAFHTEQFINSAAGQKYLRRVQTITGTSTVGLTEGLSTSAEVYDSIANMTEEQARNSDKYIEYRNQGMSHEKATEKLAEEAHLQTFMTVTLAAGAASFLTGAATFESQLFTGLGSIRKATSKVVKDAAKQETKKGAARTVAGAAAKGAGKAAKFVGPASAKEGTEELLQSGGGEFLSQLASFEATGEEVGPGVGRAAGEGAVVGAASGGLAQVTLGSLKKLASADPRKALAKASDYKDALKNNAKARTAVTANVDTVATGGTQVQNEEGQTSEEPATPETAQIDENPAESFDSTLKAEYKSVVHQFSALEKIRLRAEAAGKPLSEKQSQQHQLIKTLAEEEVATRLENIYEKEEGSVTDQDKAVLRWAAAMGFSVDTQRLDAQTRAEVDTEVKLAEDFSAAAQTSAEVAAATPEANRSAVLRVHDEKFGDVITERGGNSYPGLGYYNRRMRELMSVLSPTNAGTDENAELDSLMRRLSNFRGSQNRYLDAVRQAIRTKENAPIAGTNKEVVYTEPTAENKGGTVALERLLTQEQAQFEEIRQGLLNRYKQWTAAGDTTIRNTADTAGNQARREAQQAESQDRADNAAARKANTVVDPDARNERLELRKNTEKGTKARQQALIGLRRRLEQEGSQDLELLEQLKAEINTINKAERDAKKARRQKKDTVEEQRPDGTPQFSEETEVATVGKRRARRAGGTVQAVDGETETKAPSLRDVVSQGDTGAALDHIIKSGESGGLAPIAARVREVIGKRKVPIVTLSDNEFQAKFKRVAAGAYYQGKIYINADRTRNGTKYRNTVLHEAIHAAINGHIKNGISPKLKERLRLLNREVILALTNRAEGHDLALARILAANPEELLTHGTTTPYLQNFLREMQVGEQTLWDKFVEFVADLLNVPKGSALGEVLNITEAIYQEAAGTEAEANSEGADVGAPAPADATEQEAEAPQPGITDDQLAAKQAADEKAIRLSEAKRLRTLFQNNRINPDQAYLAHEADRQLLQRLLQEGVPTEQAIEQVLASIEPNPEARDVSVEPAVPQDVIDQAGSNAAVLNAPGNTKSVKARNPFARLYDYTVGLLTGSLEQLQQAFTKRVIAPKASSMWNQRSQRVKDLLASEDSIMEILTDPGSRERFFEQAGTTPAEERALRTFANFYNQFSRVLNETFEEERGPIDAKGNQAVKNPLYFFRDQTTGKLDSNVVGAMALEAMQYLIGSGAQTIRNTDDDIRSILGIDDFATVDPEARQVLGRGSLRNLAVQELGQAIVRHLNISQKNEARPLGHEALIAALGAQTLATLTQLGPTNKKGELIPRVQQIVISRNEWNHLKSLHEEEGARRDTTQKEAFNEQGDIILVTNTLDNSAFDPLTNTFPEVDVNAKMRGHVEEGRGIFDKLFGSTQRVRTPMFNMPEAKNIAKKVLRSISNVPQIMQERLLHDAQQHWQADTKLLDLINKFENPMDFLAAAHGLLSEEEIANLHVELRNGAEGHNRALVRDLSEALRWNAQYGDRKFYLPSRMTRSGRFIIDSNVINPQANKLHRFMFVRDQWTRAVTKGQMSTDEYNALMMAIGLGMGMKTDSKPVAEIVQAVEKAFTEDTEWRAAIEAIQNAGEKFTDEQQEALTKVLHHEGTHTFAALKAAADYFGAADGDTVSISLPHETDGVTNGYIIGLMMTPPGEISREYRDLLNAGGIYFDDDPWQNLAQYKAEGNLDNYQHIAQDARANLAEQVALAKAVEDKVLKDYAKQRKIRDRIPGRDILIQRAQARVSSSGLVPSMNELDQLGNENQEETKAGRQWAKDPLMVTSYGAGMASVGRQVVSNALEKFYGYLGDSQTIEELTFNLNRAYQIANMVVLANNRANIPKMVGYDQNGNPVWQKWQLLGTDNRNGLLSTADVQLMVDRDFGGDIRRAATEFRLSKDARDLMRLALNQTYGDALANSLESRLAPVLDIRARLNAGNQLINMMFVAEYQRQVSDIEKAGNVVTNRQKQNIINDLMRQGLVPTIATATSQGIDDSLEMTKMTSEILRSGPKSLLEGVAFLNEPAQLNTIAKGLNGQERVPPKTKSLTGRLNAAVPTWDVGVSAVVKSIHALDGVINSLVWGQGKYPVLNVHDAQVSPWYAAAEIAQNANVAFGETLAGYDLPAEFLSTLNRIMGSLWEGNDSRLSKEARAEIAETMAALNETFEFLQTPTPSNLATAEEIGNWVIRTLKEEVANDQQVSQSGKSELFGRTRSINQFAQEGTEIGAPGGIDINEPTAWAGTNSVTPTLTEALISEDTDPDVQFAEEFENQFESEKVESIWEGLAEYETGDVDVPHQNHLRNLIKNIVKPGLQGLETLFEELLDKPDAIKHAQVWEGYQLFNQTAANTLTTPEDISLQERAAQEYVSMIAYAGIQGDHFVRKELRRLYELAQDNVSIDDFMPAEVVGDPAIARDLAQQRYDHIFNAPNANEGYARFLAIGLTNNSFAKALERIDNSTVNTLPTPDWSKGYLRAMMSIFRQALQRIAGVGQRYSGGNVQNAVQALALATVAANQKNLQRLHDLRTGADGTSRIQKINQRIVDAVNDRFVEPLAKGLEATNKKRLDPKNPTLPGFLKAATYVALRSRNDEVRDEYNKFYRQVTAPYGVGKDNALFETIAEVTPWASENLNWISLLRKSKYIVDMARQEVNDHTRSFLNDSFDKNNYMSKAHKMAMTNTILKTDLNSLLDADNDGLTLGQLAELLRDPNARVIERDRLESMLRQAVAKEGNPQLFFLFQNQARSLGNFMTKGQTTVENGMLNAHNIVQQYMLDELDRTQLKNPAELESIVDRLATIYALNQQTANDLRLTNDIVQHEMSREDRPADNGFSRMVGMHIDFKELAKQNLFDGQPIQMIKGYVYEIFDGDVNVEYVEEGSDRQAEVEADGMILVGELPKDSHDLYKGKRLLYKGMKGLNTYNKSIVSLTDLQHRGANLFSTNGYQSQTSLENLAYTRGNSYLTARRQFEANFTKPGANMVPVLNNKGEIVDYRYMMSESNKRKILKKEDPFDRVMPRMFASITDRNNTQEINKDVVDLLAKEYRAGRNDPGLRFVKVGRTSTDKAGRDMWNLLPESMQREAKKAFGFDGLYVRDDVANLVLGFRKMTISNLKKPGEEGGTLWGRGTPVVRMAEKVWQEVVSLMRVKIAILTPAVVVGNIASNTAMLLSEGIPVNYIRKNAAEAISAMRQYQKDRQKATELMRQIGSRSALGQDTRALEARLNRLESDLAANPVGQLVEEGLFTSITADLGVDDDTIRGSLIQKAEDALGNKGGKAGKVAAHVAKEAYMLPGSKGYQAAVAATQYGDFVGRYVKFKYDTQVNKMDKEQAINEALAAFIYYDIPQPKYLQALNDSGLVMFTKFFMRIQHIVARMYSQNPASAFSVLALQKGLLPDPFNENIMNYGMGDGLTNKWNNPLNLPGKAWNTLNPTEPALLQWILNPFGL